MRIKFIGDYPCYTNAGSVPLDWDPGQVREVDFDFSETNPLFERVGDGTPTTAVGNTSSEQLAVPASTEPPAEPGLEVTSNG